MDILRIRDWYHTPLGHMARRSLQGHLNQAWKISKGETILVVGYGAPYIKLWDKNSEIFSAMLTSSGAVHWPEGQASKCILADEKRFPFKDGAFDKVFIMHGLEFSQNDENLLGEVWRILKPAGDLLTVIPNRRGYWSRRENSPFSRGKPYSFGQIRRILSNNNFQVSNQSGALFTPPYDFKILQRYSGNLENFGQRWWNGLGGVVITLATKDVYGANRIHSKKRSAIGGMNGIAQPNPLYESIKMTTKT